MTAPCIKIIDGNFTAFLRGSPRLFENGRQNRRTTVAETRGSALFSDDCAAASF